MIEREGESIEHLRIKDFFYLNLPFENGVKEIVLEKRIGDRIADIYLKLSNDKEIAIEVQHSMILETEIIDRTKDYNNHGIYVLWILNGTSYDRYPKIEAGFQLSKPEKYLQKMYQHRTYYLNMTKDGLNSFVYPLHFTNYYESKYSNLGLMYYRRSKSKSSVIPGTIPSLKLITFRNKGYKLARFTDGNVKEECIRSVSRFLRTHNDFKRNTHHFKKKLSYKEKLYFAVISEFQDKFWVYLLFEALKYLKVIEYKEFFMYARIQKLIP